MPKGAEGASVQDPTRTSGTAAGVELTRLVLELALGLTAAFLFVEANGLPTSRWETLGAGSFPKLVFALLALLCGCAAVGSARRLLGASTFERRAMASLPRAWLVERRLVVGLFVLFAVYLVAIPRTGFALATFGFMLLAGGLLAPRTVRAGLIVTILAVLFSFGLERLFADVFNVFLPRGR